MQAVVMYLIFLMRIVHQHEQTQNNGTASARLCLSTPCKEQLAFAAHEALSIRLIQYSNSYHCESFAC